MSSIVCLPILPKRGSTVGIVDVGRLAFQDAARAEFGAIGRVLRIVGQFRFFLGVEMVQIAEELVEAVHGRQRFIAIANVVLAELARGIPEVLEQPADRGIQLTHAHRRAGEAHLRQPGANAVLAGEESGAARGARLLAVVVLELDAFAGDAIDVRRFVAHQAVGVGTDIRDADVIAPDDEDVRLPAGRRGLLHLRLRHLDRRDRAERGDRRDRRASKQDLAAVQSAAFERLIPIVFADHRSLPLRKTRRISTGLLDHAF